MSDLFDGFIFAITSSSLFKRTIPRPRLLFPGFMIHTFITPSMSICGQYFFIFFKMCFDAKKNFCSHRAKLIYTVPVTLLLSDVDSDRVAYLKWHIVSNEESLSVNDLIVPADKLIPLMRPDPLHFLIDILVRLCANVVAASLDREF